MGPYSTPWLKNDIAQSSGCIFWALFEFWLQLNIPLVLPLLTWPSCWRSHQQKHETFSSRTHFFIYKTKLGVCVCVCVYWNPNKKGTNHGNKSVWCLTAALWVLFGRVELHIMCLSIIKIIIINTSYSPRQPLCLDRPQYKPHPLRLFAIMMSVTASNTTWMFPVSVAQVRWQ